MKKFKLLLVLSLVVLYPQSKAQDTLLNPMQIDILTIGVGGGLDYGGLVGGNLHYYINPYVGVFAGLGYAMIGAGYNFGAKFRLISEQKFSRYNPYLQAMYGYNAVIAVEGASELNKMFYGPSFGIGFDYRMRPMAKGYWSFAMLVPIRSSEVDAYIDVLKTNHGVEFKNELIPLAFSIGYRFILQAKTTNLQVIKQENQLY